MKLKDLHAAIQKLSPLELALDWDNVGLLVGDPEKNIQKILVTIDVTRAVLNEAIRQKADWILSYHPVIWDGLKRVTAGGEGDIVHDLIRAGIGVYSIHTAYDIVEGGTNDQLAGILGLIDTEPIGDYVNNPEGPHYKVVVFLPREAVNQVAGAMFDAGAGAIGNYSHCSYRTEGTGTFKPLAGSHPTIGRKGKIEHVQEVRLESVVPADKVAAVIAAMRKAHPYETPAFDVMRHHDFEKLFGLGRVGRLDQPTSLTSLISKIKKATGAKAVGIVGPRRRKVAQAAVCAGSCGKIIYSVIARGCDLYLTGEIKHHEALAAAEAGMTCLCLSHSVSERFALKKLAKQLKKELRTVTITLSRTDHDPFVWKEV